MTDLEFLSAYLDNQLSPKDRAQIESRLKTDSKLQRTLAELRAIKTQLHALPAVRPPRSFTLKPETIRSRSAFNWIPILNWSTVVAAILFAAVISVDLFRAPLSARVEFSAPMQAPAPESAMKAADQQTPITLTPTRTPAAISAVATSTMLAAPNVGAAGAAESPKAVTPPAQALAPAVRSSQPAADQIATPTPTTPPSPTPTISPPTHTATAVVIAAPVSVAAQESAASPLRVPQIILGSILFILIALLLITRVWK